MYLTCFQLHKDTSNSFWIMSVPAGLIFIAGIKEHLYKFPWNWTKEFNWVPHDPTTALVYAVCIYYRSLLIHPIVHFSQTVLKGHMRRETSLRFNSNYACFNNKFTFKKRCNIVNLLLLEVLLICLPFVEVEERKVIRVFLQLLWEIILYKYTYFLVTKTYFYSFPHEFCLLQEGLIIIFHWALGLFLSGKQLLSNFPNPLVKPQK